MKRPRLTQETLDEEEATDEALTEIAKDRSLTRKPNGSEHTEMRAASRRQERRFAPNTSSKKRTPYALAQ